MENFYKWILYWSVFTLFVSHYSTAITITTTPTTYSLREDSFDETLLFTILLSGVTAGNTVTCTLSSANSNFFMKPVSGTSDYGIYVKGNPSGLSYPSTYTMTATCTESPSGSSTGQAFTVTLTQNQTPVITNLPGYTSTSCLNTSTGTNIFTVASTDTENDQIYYEMDCSPIGCPLQIFQSGQILTTSSLLGSAASSYSLNIYVNDSRTKSSASLLSFTITDLNSAPVISNKVSTVQTISENAPVNTTIYQYLVTDSDAGDTHMWTATYNPTSGINYFTIDSGTGLVKTSGAIDFEALAATSFTVTVIVTDGQASDTTTLSITVDNVNESPTFPKTSYVLNTVESAAGASIGNPNFAASDPDSSTTLTYSTTCSTVSIDSSIGSASFTSAYDLDVVGTATNITCPITVSDGSLSVSTSLLITITNINDNTPTFGSSAYTFIVISTTAVNTVIGSIAATDGDIGTYGTLTYELDQISLGNEYFAVSSTGDLSIKTSISSFAIGAVYSLTATVTDGGGLNDTAPITIIIPSTTTTTYVTSDRPITFFEDNRNIAWFTVVMIVAAITGALITYMIVKYVWLFKNKYVPQKQIPEPEKNKGIKEGKWKPWKIWEQNRY